MIKYSRLDSLPVWGVRTASFDFPHAVPTTASHPSLSSAALWLLFSPLPALLCGHHKGQVSGPSSICSFSQTRDPAHVSKKLSILFRPSCAGHLSAQGAATRATKHQCYEHHTLVTLHHRGWDFHHQDLHRGDVCETETPLRGGCLWLASFLSLLIPVSMARKHGTQDYSHCNCPRTLA